MQNANTVTEKPKNILERLIKFFLEDKIMVVLLMVLIVGLGVYVAPFDWHIGDMPRDPVPVDAIPDIGENQQIVFTEWMGRSPQDIEDQITYPLTVSLLGIPGVKTIRSYSFFGFSSVYVIFDDGVDFYWSRSRILEKLNSLPANLLPTDAKPTLGPDATALGQIFWYTLEGRDAEGQPTGGWDLHELRSAQDWYVRYSLLSTPGVSEVASIGGFVQEYQIDVDPNAMRAYGVTLENIFQAVKMSNVDVGARTIEVNKAEYVIRGVGFIKSVDDIAFTSVKKHNDVPVYIKDIAEVHVGPALRRGAMDKGGAEVVGGVVVVRYGENPLATIKELKKKITEISGGLPSKVLPDGRTSQVTIVPFYDRTGLIYETLDTLNTALTEEIVVTIIVVIFFVMHLSSSLIISGLLPLAVLFCFSMMKLFGVDANIVALSGIAIAIGTMVDMGIVITENILKHMHAAGEDERKIDIIYRATVEVGSAILTAVSTTVISFLPVFTMVAAEGKLFKPLAFTKTFALIGSVVVALMVVPACMHFFATRKKAGANRFYWRAWFLIGGGLVVLYYVSAFLGLLIALYGVYCACERMIPESLRMQVSRSVNWLAIVCMLIVLAKSWVPLGLEKGLMVNGIFTAFLLGGLLLFFRLFYTVFPRVLTWCLYHKKIFLIVPVVIVLLGTTIWLGFDTVFGFVPKFVRTSVVLQWAHEVFPGLGKEFMPSLDEGSFLFMPTTMPHASIGEAMDVLHKQNKAINAIPEISLAVGKIGRVDSPLDPAPISMIETIINYTPEYVLDDAGRRIRFAYDKKNKLFVRDASGALIEDRRGRPYRQWRAHIHSPDDIWQEIIQVTAIPGSTSAPKLQPIAARIVMLQSGMRAPMGVKIKGPDLATIEDVGFRIEQLLKEVPSVEAATVIADRVIGKPYLEINIDRKAIARYGIHIRNVQDVIEIAVGGKQITSTVEGRERYAVRVRYQRELRDSIESLEKILVATPDGAQVPLAQLATIVYVQGPQAIKSEDTFLTGYVIFDKKADRAEVDVVEECERYLKKHIAEGTLTIPAGVSYRFAGSYENQVRSAKKLRVVLPLALVLIFLILYCQFRSPVTAMLIFSGIFIAWSGGFIMLWLYAQPWFLDVNFFDVSMRTLFQVHPINLSVAVWVGFLALFGIATDDGVVVTTYLQQTFAKKDIRSIDDIRRATGEAAGRRIRPCLMTSATTILALLPVLTATGRGADVMVPMAIPSFGGMTVVLLSVFVVPVLYCAIEEMKFKQKIKKEIKK